jgi:hypothetical protein
MSFNLSIIFPKKFPGTIVERLTIQFTLNAICPFLNAPFYDTTQKYHFENPIKIP